jgi:hypothetical protein
MHHLHALSQRDPRPWPARHGCPVGRFRHLEQEGRTIGTATVGALRLGKPHPPSAVPQQAWPSGEWNNDDYDVLALRPAVTVLPLRHFARENCALGEDAISCTACLAHEGTKPRRSIKRRDFRDGSHCSGASAASRFGCNSHSVCPLELGV